MIKFEKTECKLTWNLESGSIRWYFEEEIIL